MKSASSNEIKAALLNLHPKEVVQICLRLLKYKRENKELLTYLLFEANDENLYIENIKADIDEQFSNLVIHNWSNMIKKFRKINRLVGKYIKFSGSKNVEVAAIIYFNSKLKKYVDVIESTVLKNMYNRNVVKVEKALQKLDEDLQFDYKKDMENLKAII